MFVDIDAHCSLDVRFSVEKGNISVAAGKRIKNIKHSSAIARPCWTEPNSNPLFNVEPNTNLIQRVGSVYRPVCVFTVRPAAAPTVFFSLLRLCVGRGQESMASALARRARGSASAALWSAARGLASVGSDIVSAAPGVSLQKARSWDEGVATKFSTTSLKDIFHVRHSTRSCLPGPLSFGQRICIDFTNLRFSVCCACVCRGRKWSFLACL